MRKGKTEQLLRKIQDRVNARLKEELNADPYLVVSEETPVNWGRIEFVEITALGDRYRSVALTLIVYPNA